MSTVLLGLAVRGAVVLALALVAVRLLRPASSDVRRVVLGLALGAVLLLPLVSAVAPSWELPRAAGVLGRPVAEPLADDGAPVAAPRDMLPAAAPVAPRSPSSTVPRWPSVIALAWALGASLVLARFAVAKLRAHALVRSSTPAPPGWSRAAARACARVGLSAPVRVTRGLSSPAVTGILWPVVLVPEGADDWSDARKDAVLIHELSHVRQRDCLVQLVAELVCALHWFDPLAWLVARRLRIERELSADDGVLAAGTRASDYAESLVAIALAQRAPRGVLGVADRSELGARVEAIVDAARPRRRVSRAGAVASLGASLGALAVVACAAPASNGDRAPSGVQAARVAPPVPPPASGGDPAIQAIAEDEVERLVTAWAPRAAAILVLEPSTGRILANAGREGGARADVAVGRAYVTGSTFKAITLAGALEDGVITPADRFDCENGKRAYGDVVLRDAGSYATLSLADMLAVSSNIGFSKVFDRLGGEAMLAWTKRFHLGASPDLSGAASGWLPARPDDRSFRGAVFAIGEAATASPLQMAAAYAVFANDGAYVAPTLAARDAGSVRSERVLRPETARAVRALLRDAVEAERATGKAARVPGVAIAGKTGTAEWTREDGTEGAYASFVGMAPADAPRFVVVVGAEQPRDGGAGGKVAAPVFARVVSRILRGG